MQRNLFLFAVMTLIWGTTWIAIKAGVASVSPLVFASARFLLVSAALIPFVSGICAVFARERIVRVIVTGLLVNVATYGLIFWGMKFVPSGISGLTNLSFIAIGLFGFAVFFGQERPTWGFALSVAAGISGLVILFWGNLGTAVTGMVYPGALAIIGGTLAYCLGSVLSKPLMMELTPLQLTAGHAAVAAVAFPVASLMLDPDPLASLAGLLSPGPLSGLLFLVIFGTLVAYTIYLRLVRDWGAPRAGLYAFTSPVIALVMGALVFAEPLGWRQVLGAALMLSAAGFAMRARS